MQVEKQYEAVTWEKVPTELIYRLEQGTQNTTVAAT